MRDASADDLVGSLPRKNEPLKSKNRSSRLLHSCSHGRDAAPLDDDEVARNKLDRGDVLDRAVAQHLRGILFPSVTQSILI
jgi:hypothetical protein